MARRPIVSAAEVMQLQKDTRIFEVTWFPGASEETQSQFETGGHVASSCQLDVQNDLSIPVGDEAKLNFTRDRNTARIAERLGALGLTSTADSVVVYHRSGESLQSNLTAVRVRPPACSPRISLHAHAVVYAWLACSQKSAGLMGATRAWWTLTSWGFHDVRVLDGGLDAWKAAGGELKYGPADRIIRTTFDEASLVDNASMVATASDVLAATSSDTQIVDTLAGWPNTAERYGKRYGPERQGHIASAFNVPCGELLQPDGCFKPDNELRHYFEAQGTDLSVPLIAY